MGTKAYVIRKFAKLPGICGDREWLASDVVFEMQPIVPQSGPRNSLDVDVRRWLEREPFGNGTEAYAFEKHGATAVPCVSEFPAQAAICDAACVVQIWTVNGDEMIGRNDRGMQRATYLGGEA